MAIAVDPRQTFRYVLEADRELPEEEQTVWILGVLTAAQEARAANGFVAQDEDGRMLANPGTRALAILRGGLRGVENFRFADGSAVPFTTTRDGEPDDAFLDRIRADDRIELANAIAEGSTVTASEGN